KRNANKPCVMFTRFLNKRIATCSHFSPRNSAPDSSNWRSGIATSCTGMVSWHPGHHRHRQTIKFGTQDQPRQAGEITPKKSVSDLLALFSVFGRKTNVTYSSPSK